MGCFVVAEFLLTSGLHGPSAIAEPLVFSIIKRLVSWWRRRSSVSKNRNATSQYRENVGHRWRIWSFQRPTVEPSSEWWLANDCVHCLVTRLSCPSVGQCIGLFGLGFMQVTNNSSRSIWKMLGPFATASRRTLLFYIAIYQVSLLSHTACAINVCRTACLKKINLKKSKMADGRHFEKR